MHCQNYSKMTDGLLHKMIYFIRVIYSAHQPVCIVTDYSISNIKLEFLDVYWFLAS